MIPFAEWLPDAPAYLNPGATVAKNVLPRSGGTYGPLAGLVAYSAAIGGRALGATALLDSDGNANLFAGDATKLYRLVAGSTNFADVSRAGGYAGGADGRWAFAQYGSRVAAANFIDPIQSFVIGGAGLFSDLAASAPRARHLAVVRDFLMAANTFDTLDGNRPQRVWWSAIDDPTNWPAIGSSAAAAVQSDRQDLVGEGGWIQGILGGLGVADGVVLQERAVWRMTYVGPPAVFQFDAVEGARGTPAPGSIVQVGALAYYLGEDGFYAFDGTTSLAIGANKVDRTFFADADAGCFHRIAAAADPINKLVAWAYAGAGHSGGLPNRLLIHNWESRRWSLAELETELPLRALTFGYTLDSLDSLSGSLDALGTSLDSRLYTSGRVQFAAFDAAHRLSYFTGGNLAATIETGELAGEGQRLFISGIRPLVDGGTVTASVGYRETPNAAPVFSAPTAPAADGHCPQRISARFARARVEIAAAGSWAHAQGVEARVQREGAR
jgi:hypothetical protein